MEAIDNEIFVGLDPTSPNLPGFAAGFRAPNVQRNVYI